MRGFAGERLLVLAVLGSKSKACGSRLVRCFLQDSNLSFSSAMLSAFLLRAF